MIPNPSILSCDNLSITEYVENNNGIRNMLAAILDRAIRDAINCRMCEEKNLKREARAWLMLQDKIEIRHPLVPFSFVWICHELDLDPHAIRRAILAYEKAGVGFPC